MHHLLEHVADPVALLQDARARLKPGGALQLAVPNIRSWEARLRGWNSYEPYHLLYFTAGYAAFDRRAGRAHRPAGEHARIVFRLGARHLANDVRLLGSGARSTASERGHQAAGLD